MKKGLFNYVMLFFVGVTVYYSKYINYINSNMHTKFQHLNLQMVKQIILMNYYFIVRNNTQHLTI